MSIGMVFKTYEGHTDQVLAIAWSPDGKYLATGSDDQTVQVWSAKDGNTIFTYRGFSSWVGTVDWSPDGSRLATASLYAQAQENQVHVLEVQIWDTRTEKGETVYTYETNPGFVMAVDWSYDGKYLLSADDRGKIVVQETETWKSVGDYNHLNTRTASDARWSPDNYYIASCDGSSIQVWDAFTQFSLVTYSGHIQIVRGLAWSPDGNSIASGGDNGTVQIWQASER
jgi:WD40 repeat protein